MMTVVMMEMRSVRRRSRNPQYLRVYHAASPQVNRETAGRGVPLHSTFLLTLLGMWSVRRSSKSPQFPEGHHAASSQVSTGKLQGGVFHRTAHCF